MAKEISDKIEGRRLSTAEIERLIEEDRAKMTPEARARFDAVRKLRDEQPRLGYRTQDLIRQSRYEFDEKTRRMAFPEDQCSKNY